MHILIIGAAGMVGRKLTDRLVADGRLGGNEVTGLTLADVIVAADTRGLQGGTANGRGRYLQAGGGG